MVIREFCFNFIGGELTSVSSTGIHLFHMTESINTFQEAQLVGDRGNDAGMILGDKRKGGDI